MLTPEFLEKHRQSGASDQLIDRTYLKSSGDKKYEQLRSNFTARFGSSNTGALLDFYAYGTTQPQERFQAQEVSGGEDDKFTLGDVASNLGSGIKDVFSRRGDEVRQEMETSGAVGEGSIMERLAAVPQLALFLTGDVIETGFELGLEGVKALGGAAATDTLGFTQEDRDTMKQLGAQVLQAPGVQEGIEAIGQGFGKWLEFKEEHPMAANTVESLASIADLIGFTKVGKAGMKGLRGVAGTVGEAVDPALDVGRNAARRASDMLQESIEKQSMNTAVDLVTPMRGRAGSKSAVNELKFAAKRGEVMGGRVTPSRRTMAIAEEVAKVDGIKNKNYIKDLDLIANRQNEIASSLSNELKRQAVNADEFGLVMGVEIGRELAEEAVSAPAAKLVNDMLDEMNRLVKRNSPQNLDDIWQIRKGVDDFVKTKSGELPAGVKREGIDLFRGKMNEFIDVSAPSAGARDAYRQWSLLEDGLETVANKASRQAETWSGKLMQKIERMPLIKTETRRDLLEIATTVGVATVGSQVLGTAGTAVAVVGIPSFVIYKGGKAVFSKGAKKFYKRILDAISEVPAAKRTGEMIIMERQVKHVLENGFLPIKDEPKLLSSPSGENRLAGLKGVQKGVDDVGGAIPEALREGNIVNLGSDGFARVISNKDGVVRVTFAGEDKFPVILNAKGLKKAKLATVEDFGDIKPGKSPKKMQLRMWKDEVKRGAQQVDNAAKAIPKELEPLVKEARKFKSAEEFVDSGRSGFVRLSNVSIDPDTIKLSDDITKNTALNRSKRFSDVENANPIVLRINKDGQLQVVDGNARLMAFRKQGKKINLAGLNIKKSDKSQLTDFYNLATKNQ